MAKKAVTKVKPSYDLSSVSYTLGIASIVFAFFQPLAAIILGIIGLVQSKHPKNDLERRAKKFNTIGIILGIILLVITLIIAAYGITQGLGNLNFPSA